VTLEDRARDVREGSGDVGICFEYARHEAIANQDSLTHPVASEVLESFCGIDGGCDTVLFGPEKEECIPILEHVQNALTDDARVYVGTCGQLPKLKRSIPQIVRAFRRNEERNRLARSISGLWKADLFVGKSVVQAMGRNHRQDQLDRAPRGARLAHCHLSKSQQGRAA